MMKSSTQEHAKLEYSFSLDKCKASFLVLFCFVLINHHSLLQCCLYTERERGSMNIVWLHSLPLLQESWILTS